MTLYLVRHGSAGRRNGADPHDGDRHLDDRGRRQAAAVSSHLSGQPIEVVVSSPLPRCVETVAPLADALGLVVQLDERLREGAEVAEAWELVEQLAAGTAVLCSHGDVIPDVIGRCEARGMRMPDRPGFSKGSVWALRGWDGTGFAKGSWDKLR
jgi:broad specificity phosphatase PhoE